MRGLPDGKTIREIEADRPPIGNVEIATDDEFTLAIPTGGVDYPVRVDFTVRLTTSCQDENQRCQDRD
jgi:hypothetical protein